MIALDSVLPELERAVEQRVESPLLRTLEQGDLRDLVYKLVERNRVGIMDPQRYFAELITAATERHADMHHARAHSVSVRVELLRHLLRVLRPALPSLLGPVVVETVRHPNDHEVREHHKIFVGFELLDGEKTAHVGGGVQVRSGRSWWIVAIPGDHVLDDVDARYALATHGGRLAENGTGRTHSNFQIVTSAEAATQIHDEQFVKVIRVLHERLLVLAKSPKLARLTDSLWRVATTLDSALGAMTSVEDDNPQEQ